MIGDLEIQLLMSVGVGFIALPVYSVHIGGLLPTSLRRRER